MQVRNVKSKAAQRTTCCTQLDRLLSPQLFKALADPTRVALLAELARRGEAQTVSEIAPCCTVDLSVVSRHLALLRQAGILAAEKRGRQVLYRVRYRELAAALRSVAAAIEGCCPKDDPRQAQPVPVGDLQ